MDCNSECKVLRIPTILKEMLSGKQCTWVTGKIDSIAQFRVQQIYFHQINNQTLYLLSNTLSRPHRRVYDGAAASICADRTLAVAGRGES